MTCLEPKEEPVVLDQPENKVRPFFSIIISCYNSGKTIGRLLDSILRQELTKDEFEVVISDDHSTEPYVDILKQYQDKINFVFTMTEYNCCPGNTREAGAQAATGEWLCFSDHDDEFIDGALRKVKDHIIENNIKYFVVTDFYEIDEDTRKPLQHFTDVTNGWTHGRFYNHDNLWKRYDVHYKKDLMSHEDIYLTCTIDCIGEKLTKTGTVFKHHYEIDTYLWHHKHDSLSHKDYDGTIFLEKHFTDYLESTLTVYIDNYLKGITTFEYAEKHIMDTLPIAYFYFESFEFYGYNQYRQQNVEWLRNFFTKIKELFYLNNYRIWYWCAKTNALIFGEAYPKAQIATGYFIPTRTFGDWIQYLSPEEDFVPSLYF